MNRPNTPVLEEFFEGEGTGTKPQACQTTLTLLLERQGLSHARNRKSKKFIHSHT